MRVQYSCPAKRSQCGLYSTGFLLVLVQKVEYDFFGIAQDVVVRAVESQLVKTLSYGVS